MPDRGDFQQSDDGSSIPTAMVVTRVGERLAALEARSAVEISGLKDDTGVIRSAIHGINNEMQKFVQAEQRCADNLAQIALQTKDLPLIATTIAAFSEMRPKLNDLLIEREQRVGLSSFGKRFAMIVGAGAALIVMIGGIFGGLIWLTQHLKPL